MRFLRYLPLAAIMFVGACDEEGAVTDVARPPLAFIRYVHAVPDFGPTDFKFIDAVEYSPTYANASFRTVGIYQGARAGSRRIRVFRNSSNITETQQVLVDTTLNLTANTYYTIMHLGFASAANGTPSQRLVVLTDNLPDRSTTQTHVGVVNAIIGATTTNQDVFVCTPSAVNIVSGNNQVGNPNALLPDTLRVQVVDNCGFNVANENVRFRIASGGGRFRRLGTTSDAAGDTAFTVAADDNGVAAIRWRLGASGVQQVGATTSQVTTPTLFTATFTPAPIMGTFNSAAVAALPVPTTGSEAELAAGSPVLFSNVAPGTRSSVYSARPLGRFRIRTANTTTLTSLAVTEPFAGVAGTVSTDPVGGYGVAGTQFSMFLFPRSTASTAAPQGGAFAAPAIISVVDRQPPRTVPE